MNESMEVDSPGFEDEMLEDHEDGELSPFNHQEISSAAVAPVSTRIANSKVKAEEKTKRFGLPKDSEKSLLKEADNLYASFGINERSSKNFRLNVLNMYGVENVATKDIFKYFEDYAPASVEWISDIACNIIWLDSESAARALLGLSSKIVGLKKEKHEKFSDEDSDADPDELIVNGKLKRDENFVNAKDVRYPLPPGTWRKGRDFMNLKNVFLRFATHSDRKGILSEKISENLKKRVSSETGEVKGILTTSRKRPHKDKVPLATSPPMLQSHGIQTTNGSTSKNPWGSLSQSWGVTDFVEDDYLPKGPPPEMIPVRERLGFRRRNRFSDPYNPNVIVLSDEEEAANAYQESYNDYYDEYDTQYDNDFGMKYSNQHNYGRNVGQNDSNDYMDDDNSIEFEEEYSSDDSEDEENWNRRSKIPRMRMHADDEEEKLIKRKGRLSQMVSQDPYQRALPIAKDLRKTLVARRKKPPSQQELIPLVARRKLPPPQDEPITVIVTNPIAIRSNFDNIVVTEDEQEDEEEIGPSVAVSNERGEEEEGEILDDSCSDSNSSTEHEKEVADEDEEEEEDDDEEEVSSSSDDDSEDEEKSSESSDSSDESVTKEIQGPKGSVIRVIPPKPRLQSTVSTVSSRIDDKKDKIDRSDRYESYDRRDSHRSKGDLRHTLSKNDLRSKIGKNSKRSRSPLRIELRNDKYSNRSRK